MTSRKRIIVSANFPDNFPTSTTQQTPSVEEILLLDIEAVTYPDE